MDDKQIKKWVKEGTITQEQANKMLADLAEDSPRNFSHMISVMGSILIFVGMAWLVARNWHSMPDIVKVIILVGSTLGAFYAGVSLREKNQEGVGRGLLVLGSLLYVLSLS